VNDLPRTVLEYPDLKNLKRVALILGVFEHWNNGTEKKYSGNLGKPHGIELFPVG
jgi:hypothetical protein